MRGATRRLKEMTEEAIEFQSTLLMRGATVFFRAQKEAGRYFNPRSSCEERRAISRSTKANGLFQSTLLMRGATSGTVDLSDYPKYISIHAPHARSDGARLVPFLSQVQISIHAPHARSDTLLWTACLHRSHFNPRSSCEERRRFSTTIVILA